MFDYIDATAWIVNALIWLGPLLYNAASRRFRLAHPISLLPIVVVYLSTVPMGYRIAGETMLRSSERASLDPWFLAAPTFVLAASGLCYHLGVLLAGVPLKLREQDAVFPYAGFPADKNTSALSMFVSALVVLAVVVFLRQFAAPSIIEDSGHGGHLFNALLFSSYLLPLMVLPQNPIVGGILLLLLFPIGFLIRSKASFLFMVVGILIFYETKILKISKVTTVLLALAIALTPLAVARYSAWGTYEEAPLEISFDSDEWAESIDAWFHREYAFESFALVYDLESGGAQPLGIGSRITDELLQIIPSYVWPDKPIKIDEFPSQYPG